MHAGREKMLYRVEPGQLCVHTLTNLLNDQDYQAQATAEIGSGLAWAGWMLVRFEQPTENPMPCNDWWWLHSQNDASTSCVISTTSVFGR